MLVLGGIIFKQSSEKEVVKSITIGAILPLTGPTAQLGQEEKKGLLMAMDELNSHSSKPNFRLVVEDSKGTAKDGVVAAHKLIESDQAQIVFTSLTPVSQAIGPQFSQPNSLLIVFGMD